MTGHARARRAMVTRQLARRGIADSAVLEAMGRVPRHRFVPDALATAAYEDRPLGIGHGQTISQPYIVALMTEMAGLVPGRSHVLEIGTGSGYHTAVLADIARHVWSIERVAPLSAAASRRLDDLGTTNVTLLVGDGALGHAASGPYDAVLAAAAAPRAPEALLRQLAPGGRLVLPVGSRDAQHLVVYERTDDGIREHDGGAVRFVPLVSPAGFADPDA